MLGVSQELVNNSLDLDYVGVKVPMFSFSRLVGADPMLGVEMASTGEVGCLGKDLNEALLHGLLATGFQLPHKGVLLSLGPVVDKYWFADEARIIGQELGLPIYATEGTAETLTALGIKCTSVGKKSGDGLSGLEVINDGRVDLVINIPREYDAQGRPDGYLIRRRAVDAGVPLITDLQLARAVIEALRWIRPDDLNNFVAWNDHLASRPFPLT
jgi:carbamoyl-phosphate synthase large subunit